MWPNNADPNRCPIAAYIKYSDKRPPTYCSPTDPFYLATNTRLIDAATTADEHLAWFKRQPIGVNKLSTIMAKMSESAGIRRLTNHSARKHLVQKLSDAGIPANQIMQVTGHRNVNSINNYSSININQQKTISNIIANPEQHGPPPPIQPQPIPDINVPHSPSFHAAQPSPLQIKDINIPQTTTATSATFPKELFNNCQVKVDHMTVNIVNNYHQNDPTPKRRRILNVISSDSDDE
jgi:hypothetical protein